MMPMGTSWELFCPEADDTIHQAAIARGITQRRNGQRRCRLIPLIVPFVIISGRRATGSPAPPDLQRLRGQVTNLAYMADIISV